MFVYLNLFMYVFLEEKAKVMLYQVNIIDHLHITVMAAWGASIESASFRKEHKRVMGVHM